jgi:hypothetical protein
LHLCCTAASPVLTPLPLVLLLLLPICTRQTILSLSGALC